MVLAPAAAALAAILCMGAAAGARVGPSVTLRHVTYASRHGIRTPFQPDVGSVTDWSNYTRLPPKTAADYGMSPERFESQQLTPHGQAVLELLGAYWREKWAQQRLFAQGDCERITVFADDSPRDVETAEHWLRGFGCADAPVHVPSASHLPEMRPVCSGGGDGRHPAPGGCSLANEEQVKGLFGGDVAALNAAYAPLIRTVERVLQMQPSAPLCARVMGAAAPRNCSLLSLPYSWTGLYYRGMFLSPLTYAEFFTEVPNPPQTSSVHPSGTARASALSQKSPPRSRVSPNALPSCPLPTLTPTSLGAPGVDAGVCERAARLCLGRADGSRSVRPRGGGSYVGPYVQRLLRFVVPRCRAPATKWCHSTHHAVCPPLRADLYQAHIELMWLGTNFWNARAYGSQGLAFIVGSLTQAATGASGGAFVGAQGDRLRLEWADRR